MQAIFERAYRLGKVDADDRQKFYRQLNSRGWKTREPGSDQIVAETPSLVQAIREQLGSSGLDQAEISHLVGKRAGERSPFTMQQRILRAV